ncbi:dihydroorotate dehydrogenase-like protein [Candidatus Fermentibacteria bacterium]|nr:dihydroorotate dehydrogenase-like protein [Candidatus Fermentibacteria bacterium]
MSDLSTTYLGLELRNPIVVGSSGLSNSPKKVEACARAGAGAVVLKSIFEEEINEELQKIARANAWYPEAADYVRSYGRQNAVSHYLDLIYKSKDLVEIPVIASIHCVSPGAWTEFASRADKAGADAIELNVFMLPTDTDLGPSDYDKIHIDILQDVKSKVDVPVCMKIGTHFSSLARMAMILSHYGADGLVLFNRFLRMDIDIDDLSLVPGNPFSVPAETLVPLRWVSLLSKSINCDIVGTTGIHSWKEVVKHLLAGASAVQICSCLYQNGVEHIGKLLSGVENWMDDKGFGSIDQFRGKLARKAERKATAWERVQYMKEE